MREIEKKAAALLERCETVILSSITEEGAPRPCVVSKLRAQGFRTIFAATGLSGRKTAQFQKNSLAGACFFLDGDSVTMTGSVTVHTGEKILHSCWQDWMQEHFEQGEADPDYCVLQFTAREATFWIDGEFCTIRYAKAESRCGIRCSEMDCKKEFGFDCLGCAREPDAPWGRCEIKACCEDRGYLHCGECGDFPCAALEKFAFDPVQGDKGKRLETCRCWRKETESR